MKLITSVYCIFLCFCCLWADNSEENLYLVEGETSNASELSEMLSDLREHPLNINSVSINELQKLPWLSENDISLLMEYRKTKQIRSWNDLEKLGINNVTISELNDYLVFRDKPIKHLKQQTRLGFNEAKSDLTSSLNYFQRTTAAYGKFDLGIVTQKDEGESDPIDFYSYFVSYRSEGLIKNFVAGKYRLALGQGILFAPKLGTSKSAAATTVPSKKFSAIKPYTSSFEMWDLEGISTVLNIGKFNIIPFFSNTQLNANLDSLKMITSFNESGLNLNELRKNNVQEKLFGSAFEYESAKNKVGISFSSVEFDHAFAEQNKMHKYTAGNLYFYLFNQSSLFGEIAFAEGKTAGLIGLKFGRNNFRQLILLRNYQQDFPTWHGNPFSAQSSFANETGVYYGLTVLPLKNTKINCYFDLWSFPQTRYFEKMPTVGAEQFLQIQSRISDNTLRLTIQNKQKEKYITLNEAEIRDFERLLLRLDWDQKLKDISMRSRLEFVSEYLPEDKVYGKGILFYEQAKLEFLKAKIITRISVFHSLSNPIRIKHYMYENSVSGVMRSSVLSGDGITSFLLIKYDLFKSFQIQTKISDSWGEANKMRIILQLISYW